MKTWFSGMVLAGMCSLAMGARPLQAAETPADTPPPVQLSWSIAEPLPPAAGQENQPGVARPFSGMFDGVFLVAGGANFPDKPLAEGGSKRYQDAVFAFDPSDDSWLQIGTLFTPLGEGGSVTTKAGVFCVGGHDGTAARNQAFFLKTAKKGELVIQEAAPLPVSVTMPAMAAFGDQVFVVCGVQDGDISNRVWAYSLSSDSWSELPGLPGPARTQAVAVAQNGDQKLVYLVVYGGSGIGEDGAQTALTDGYSLVITPGRETPVWQQLAPLEVDGVPVSTIGASFVASGNQHALLVGGFNAALWNEVNRWPSDKPLSEKETYWRQSPEAFGWNREIYAYHVVTGTWCRYDRLPEGILPRCGAAVEMFQYETGPMSSEQRLIVSGGEIMPGIRTAETHVAEFKRVRFFSPLSWAVIVLFFFIMVGMALWFMRSEKTADNYFRGGSRIPWYVVGMSIFATMLSSITFISIPTMTYLSDWRYFPMAVCIFLVAPIAIYFYLPFFCRLRITSAYEYLELRFNLVTRLFGSLAFNVFMVCRVAVVTLLPAIALNAVTGINVNLCILICGIITIFYCSVGGVEAVIWSDFIQGIILMGGAVLVMVILILNTEGGFGGFVSIAAEDAKLRLWDFRFLFSEPVFWVVMIQGLVSNLSSYTSDQCVVQRYITTTNERQAARSIWFNGTLSVIASIIFYTIGTALYTHYKTQPFQMDVSMPKSDSIFPIYMVMELHPLISGLVIAAIFAATISTLSTNLNSAATSITTDFFVRFNKRIANDSRLQVRYGQAWTVIVGVLGILAALYLAQTGNKASLFDEFQKFIAMLTAGLTCLFFMGVFIPRINGVAAAIGLAANYVVCYGIDYFLPAVYRPHPFTYGGIGLVVCLVVSYVLSFILPSEPRDLTGLTLKTQLKRND